MTVGTRESQNVLVATRVRPLDPTEAKYGARSILRCQQNKTIITDPAYPYTEKAFTFDHSFWSGEPTPESKHAGQIDVYNEIGRGMLAHALEGFNVCIFSYGQTNAGKTYTMMGTDDDPGIIPRFCEELFTRIEEKPSSAEVSYKVELSYFEIYNERVRCLLNPDTQKKDLRVREHPITGPFVEHLTNYIVEDFDDVLKWMRVGNQARTVCSTKFNQSSSRSHAVFTLILTQNRMDEDGQCTQVMSKINLVDLAGSERCGQTAASVSSDIFKEGVTINKSLSTLGRVIHSLSDQAETEEGQADGVKRKRQFVGYRDSILTYLLKENLGGNSKTIMLANVSPASSNYEESLNTLRYADRVKYIRNEPVVSEDHNARLIRELKQEINFLRKQLYSSVDQSNVSPGRRSSFSTPSRGRPEDGDETDSMQDMQDWKAKLEMSDQIIAEINQSWLDRLTHSQKVYQEKLQGVERELIGRTNASSYAIEDMPLLININPHPVPGEQLAHVLRPGETYLGTDDEPITEETKDDIRLSDGFNLSNPHCIFEHHDTGEVEMIPLNGSLSYVNGQLLTTTYILTHGCRIILGSNHVFLFVDPIHSKAFRDHLKAQGGGLPRIIDWAYVAKEFAEAMNILTKPEQLLALREEINTCREESAVLRESREELERIFEEFRRTPYLILVTEGTQREPTTRLQYRLVPGRNAVGPGTAINPPGAKQPVVLDYCVRSGHVLMVLGPKSLSSPLPNGYHIVSGSSRLQLILPPNERPGPVERKPSVTRAAGISPAKRASEPEVSLHDHHHHHPGETGDHVMDDMKHKLFDFQFAVLNMRDQLFPPPPDPPADVTEGEAAPEPATSPEEQELQEKRRVLQDDWLLTSKKCTAQDVLDHMTYLQHELRYLTFVSAQREQLVDQLQYAVEQGREHETEVARLHKELSRWQQAVTAMRRTLESHGLADDTLHPPLEMDAKTMPLPLKVADDAEELRRKLKETEAKLESLAAAQGTLVEAYNGLLKKQRPSDASPTAGGGGDSAGVLHEEVQLALRKVQTAELRCAQLQQKLEGRTQDYDTLYYTHQKLKEEMELQRQQLNDATSRLRMENDDARTLAKKVTKGEIDHVTVSLVSSASLPKDSIKAFNKMKDTIKLLTKLAKSKDDRIAKLEKDLQMKSDLLQSINRRSDGRLPADQTPTASERYNIPNSPMPFDAMDTADFQSTAAPTLESVMLALKAEVVHLSRASLAQLDKIASTVSRSAGMDMFKKAHAFVRRVVADVLGEAGLQEEVWPLSDRDIDRIKPHHRAHVVKALREMVICYDMIPDFVKGGLSTCDDIVRNRTNLVKIARFCVTTERTGRSDGSPVRGKSSPTHDREEDKPLKQKRSSSASSNRSSNTTIHSRDTTPSQKTAFGATSTRTTSYVSPKRHGPSATLTSHTSVNRHSSPKPGAYSTATYSSYASPPPAAPPVAAKSRTLSPRPGTTVTPTRLKTKASSPSPSPEPAAARRTDTHSALRNSSPFSADKGPRSLTPKTMKKPGSNTSSTQSGDARALHAVKAPSDDTALYTDPSERSDLESMVRRPPPGGQSPHTRRLPPPRSALR